jgi:hypothetical protein
MKKKPTKPKAPIAAFGGPLVLFRMKSREELKALDRAARKARATSRSEYIRIKLGFPARISGDWR